MGELQPVSNEPALWITKLPSVDATSNKYTKGHALIFGGYPMTGAARLAARACARMGAGLTTIVVEPHALDVYAKHLESIMVRSIADIEEARTILADERISAVLIGPGLGVGERTRNLVEAVLDASRPTVLDADALTSFADDPSKLFERLSPHCVLTPHEGEFARLFSTTGSRIERATAAARQSGAIIVLKGSETLIAHPNGSIIENPTASPHLATAGSGDVLAGLIVSLLAQGMAPLDAATAGVWVHSEIGRRLGIGLIADDMPDEVPAVRRVLESHRSGRA
jgi:NAD(P)H-hydrate epimerase